MAIIKNAIQDMESMMKPDVLEQVEREVQEELFLIKLAELRETYGIRQTDIKGFSQPAVSKLEKRKDMKLSTLLEYVHALDLNLEVKVTPKRVKTGVPKVVVILRS
jgi:hypothetical protein